jgi:predicted small lipoprotein YifL
MMRALLVIAIAACGSKPASEPLVGPPASVIAPRGSASDELVASVNGKPVWGSCVAIQAQRGPTIGAVEAEQSAGRWQVTAAGQNWNSNVVGVTTGYPEVRDWALATGSFFTNPRSASS